MNIVYKCADKGEQIIHRAGNVELQLFDDFEHKEIDDIFLNITRNRNVDIRTVHTPIINRCSCEIKKHLNFDEITLMQQTSLLAEKFAEHYKHRINIIMHLNISTSDIDKCDDDVIKLIGDILNHCPSVDICIENIVPFLFNDDKVIIDKAGYLFENTKLVDYLEDQFGHPHRFFTVLDICHAEQTIRCLNKLLKDDYSDFLNGLTLEKYFEYNKGYCRILHVSTCKKLGLRAREHGVIPDRAFVNRIMELYNKYDYNALLVLEVQENDYNNPVNAKELSCMIQSNQLTDTDNA